jgi:hypothetical protein
MPGVNLDQTAILSACHRGEGEEEGETCSLAPQTKDEADLKSRRGVLIFVSLERPALPLEGLGG